MMDDVERERHGEALLSAYEAVLRALSLYPLNHPNVSKPAARFLPRLTELREAAGDASFHVSRSELHVNGVPLKRLSLGHARVLSAWERMGLGLVRFTPAVNAESLLRFFEILGRGERGGSEALDLGQALEAAGVAGIEASVVPAQPAPDERAPSISTADDGTGTRARFLDSADELSALVETARATAGGPARMIRSLFQVLESRLLERQPVRDLAGEIEKLDPGWYRHALGGAVVAVVMGDALGLERDALSRLGEAALLRDVGLIGLSIETIRARRAEPAARESFERHPSRGAKLLLTRTDIDPTAAIVALEHHRGFDASGYPRNRAAKGLHAFSRIVAVASDYDLLTGGNTGEPSLLPAEATRDLVQGAGSAYDPAAVRALLRVVGFVPEGTAVTLRDGTRGAVAGIGRHSLLAPDVAILSDRSGAGVEPRIVETHHLAPAGEAIVVRTGKQTAKEIHRLEPLRFAH